MTELLLFRERLKEFYGRFDIFIIPLLRFLLAITAYTVINRNIGYMEKLDSPTVVLAVSLVNAVMPVNAIVLFSGIFIVIHLYRLSIICAGVILLLFTLLFLLYFHFAPKDGFAVLVTPILCTLGFPYLVPLCFGLTGTVFSAIPIACGVIVYYFINFVKSNSAVLQDMDIEALSKELKSVVDGISGNRNMRVMIIALGLSCIVVYLVHKLSVKYSWTIAVILGAVTELVIMLWGILHYDLEISTTGLFLGCLLSLVLALLMQFFILSVDYTRTEYLQFQDDEYYYYVKAVPKLSVSIPEKKVKKISGSEEERDIPVVRKSSPAGAGGDRDGAAVRKSSPTATGEDKGITAVRRSSPAGTGGDKNGAVVRRNPAATGKRPMNSGTEKESTAPKKNPEVAREAAERTAVKKEASPPK